MQRFFKLVGAFFEIAKKIDIFYERIVSCNTSLDTYRRVLQSYETSFLILIIALNGGVFRKF